jgi:hypothetical protein
MTTLMKAEHPPLTAPRLSRGFSLVVSLLAVVVIAVGAGAVVRYQAVHTGPTFQTPAGSEPASDDGSTVRAEYRDGQETTFGISIQNAAPWGITVLGFARDAGAKQLLQPVSYEVTSSGFSGAARAFEPAALGAGKTMSILVHARFTDCEFYSPGTSNTLSSVRVRYRVLGLIRTVDVPIGFGLEVVSPVNALCPRARAS